MPSNQNQPSTPGYQKQYWNSLTSNERSSASSFGYNENTWNNPTQTFTKLFSELNDSQKKHAITLGYKNGDLVGFVYKKNNDLNGNNGNNRNNNTGRVKSKSKSNGNKPNGNKPNANKPNDNKPNEPTYQHINSPYNKKKQMEGGKKSTSKKPKKIRKHKGIYQTGSKKGKLKPGYKYSGKKTQTGLKIIVKTKK